MINKITCWNADYSYSGEKDNVFVRPHDDFKLEGIKRSLVPPPPLIAGSAMGSDQDVQGFIQMLQGIFSSGGPGEFCES